MTNPSPHTQRNFYLRLSAILILALLFRLSWIIFTDHTFEDAFITFRYARQLAAGAGFVYNPGEPLYGTTTPLWTLLLAGWIAILGPEPVSAARILGLISTLGGLFFAALALRRLSVSPTQQTLALLLVACTPKLWEMDCGGMETPGVIFFIAASWYAVTAGRIGWAGLLAGLLLWVRADMLLWPAALALALAFINPRQSIRLLTTTALTYLPWVIFAWAYFGSPVPYTVTAKWVSYASENHQPLSDHLLLALEKLSPFVSSQPPDQFKPTILISAIVLLALALWQASRLPRQPALLALVIFAGLEFTRLVLTRATFFHRYFIPVLWIVLILAGAGIGAIWIGKARRQVFRRALAGFILSLVLATLGWAGLNGSAIVRLQQIHRHEAALKAAGLWLASNTPPGSTVLLEPLGYAGYYSQRVMWDEVGLVTPQVVALKQRGIWDIYQYLPLLKPDYVILHCDDALRWQQRTDGGAEQFTARYSLAAWFNPMAFDPSHPGDEMQVENWLKRGSCYEIWRRINSSG